MFVWVYPMFIETKKKIEEIPEKEEELNASFTAAISERGSED